MKTLSLEGKRALVCGASKGIGKAVAMLLAERGAEVVAVARNANTLKQLVNELPTPNHQAHSWLAADFSSPSLLASELQTFLAGEAPFQILIHNTGGPPPGLIHQASLEAFSLAFAQHLLAGQVLVQALLPGMQASQYGRIINIVSTSVRQPIPGLGVSNTVRAAVAAWAKTLADELAPMGITVNNVLPGFTRTERLAQIIATRAEKQGLSPEAVEAAMLAEVPAGRFAEPEETAEAVAFLASQAASYITGTHLPVDGGRLRPL
ncbi:short-chain dehydrogenase [bacterium (Candidatus Blackallbacteria) CG17_big_fil_post_rev_8_21_14_2_50_48_46]|uniref:Short-chain dehydrogenase n=1 Tax=bacterium (Candidatus Blackallbacteria) CG17_big_fil_post_rev_8_21_14_2_50_48_46 TaxID=2014261 RepID=A0A2M7G3N9_9BACT|nr:MAG: short-chain dehydrogenase [bacterium (Candidatus Blackallbacteria) CG18_big_fil_WC_8_21_14_2_50_49_26]PIW16341.1 MAG: short-chain dehydrogenase [bacterium (Candidatus Blackallbacteria) CG17_big_fil_post_rev_8_21_14_2_50_48_46]PIW45355.1 MAG: short-chain dehydrogenase [bacterium (Candidatus Blackallbacteria) CG13_big_fil_rev_8_21_14_2_50_49_14]